LELHEPDVQAVALYAARKHSLDETAAREHVFENLAK